MSPQYTYMFSQYVEFCGRLQGQLHMCEQPDVDMKYTANNVYLRVLSKVIDEYVFTSTPDPLMGSI